MFCSFQQASHALLSLNVLLFSHSVVSNYLQTRGLQTPGSLSFTISWSLLKLMPMHWQCHPTIWFSVISSCLLSFPISGSFQMSQLFTSGGQSIGVSASASVLPMNIQDWFPLGWTGSPCSPRDSQESSPTPSSKASILQQSAFFIVQLLRPYVATGKTTALTRRTFAGKVISLLFKMLLGWS